MIKDTAFAFILISIIIAKPQITGQVFDENGKPVSFAIITDTYNENWVISNETGWFNYNFLTEIGDTLIVSRYGYERIKLVTDSRLLYGIKLNPQPIISESVSVIGTNADFIGEISNLYYNNYSNVHSKIVLNHIPGIIIRTYGGNAGNATISSIGNPASHTKIMVNNIDLTSVQNGETDVSQIPSTLFDQISVSNSPGIIYGSGAIDAAINLSPIFNRTSIGLQYGTLNYKTIDGNLKYRLDKITLNLFAGYSIDNGNYIYRIGSNKYERENNNFNRFYYALNGKAKYTAKTNIEFFLMNSMQKRGVPGSLLWPTPSAHRNDNLLIGNLKYNYLHKNGFSSVQLNLRESFEKYTNHDQFISTESNHTVFVNSVKLSHYQNVKKILSFNILYELKQEKIESTDIGDKNRLTNSIASELEIPLFYNISIVPSLRLEKVNKLEMHQISATKLLYNGIKNVDIELIAGTGFRNPTFNDMYWIPGGNPHLKPEISKYQSLKIKYSNFINYGDYVYFDIANRYNEDMIQWVPVDNDFMNWEPQNIANTQIRNIFFGGKFELKSIPLQISGHLTYSHTKDDNLNKELLYAPKIVGFAGIHYYKPKFQIGIQAHYTGKRITAYSSQVNDTLPGYWFLTSVIQYNLSINKQILSLDVEINNLLNENYMSISGYPEPGRTMIFGIKYTV